MTPDLNSPQPDSTPEKSAAALEKVAWDEALSRAEEKALSAQEDSRRGEPGGRGESRGGGAKGAGAGMDWRSIMRYAIPAILLLVYLGYRFSQRAPSSGSSPGLSPAASLTGVERARPDKLRLNAEAEEKVARLEALLGQGDWKGVQALVKGLPQEMKAHPIFHAFEAIARIESGESGIDLLRTVEKLEGTFYSDAKRKPLLDYLRMMRAELILQTCAAPESLLARTDMLRELVLSQSALTPRALRLRVKIAERYEALGRELADSTGRVFKDKITLINARSLFQQGLRMVVAPEGWLQAQPIHPGASATAVQRLLLQIREVNRQINGVSAPWSQTDRSTWTGQKGDPIHDYPGGKW